MPIEMTPRRKAKIDQYLDYLIRTGQLKVLKDPRTFALKKKRPLDLQSAPVREKMG